MKNKKIKIGIIGLGYVGGALKHWFKNFKNRYSLFIYDKYKHLGSVEEVNQADIIFVAVPTPFRQAGGYDDSVVKDALKNIKNHKIVVIKSTILPGSSGQFQKEYPNKIILFNPEFLRAKTAVEDFLNPDKQIIGYTNNKSRLIAQTILNILPKAPYARIIKSGEAEMVKYFNNTYLAARIIFANQIYDFCQKLGAIDYKVVKECVVQDKRIGNSHFDIFTDGYRGYGGFCFPKDIKSFIQLANKLKVDANFFEVVEKINNRLNVKKQRY